MLRLGKVFLAGSQRGRIEPKPKEPTSWDLAAGLDALSGTGPS